MSYIVINLKEHKIWWAFCATILNYDIIAVFLAHATSLRPRALFLKSYNVKIFLFIVLHICCTMLYSFVFNVTHSINAFVYFVLKLRGTLLTTRVTFRWQFRELFYALRKLDVCSIFNNDKWFNFSKFNNRYSKKTSHVKCYSPFLTKT